MAADLHQFNKPSRGFTLIELIIAIVISGFAMLMLTTSLFPRSKQSAENVIAVKAVELGRAVIDEVIGRNFDENSGPNGGVPECVIVSTEDREDCTAVDELGPDDDEDSRTDYNDVDDFNGLGEDDDSDNVVDVLGDALAQYYPGFHVQISVAYAETDGGEISSVSNYKKITATITDPTGQSYTFSSIRGNF